MKNLLLNTGLFVKKGHYDINQSIEEIDKLPVQGIEIGISFIDQLYVAPILDRQVELIHFSDQQPLGEDS